MARRSRSAGLGTVANGASEQEGQPGQDGRHDEHRGHEHPEPVHVAFRCGPPGEKESWADRNLREPRPWLAVGIGALAGTPGAAYITALPKKEGNAPEWASRD